MFSLNVVPRIDVVNSCPKRSSHGVIMARADFLRCDHEATSTWRHLLRIAFRSV